MSPCAGSPNGVTNEPPEDLMPSHRAALSRKATTSVLPSPSKSPGEASTIVRLNAGPAGPTLPAASRTRIFRAIVPAFRFDVGKRLYTPAAETVAEARTFPDGSSRSTVLPAGPCRRCGAGGRTSGRRRPGPVSSAAAREGAAGGGGPRGQDRQRERRAERADVSRGVDRPGLERHRAVGQRGGRLQGITAAGRGGRRGEHRTRPVDELDRHAGLGRADQVGPVDVR